MKKSNLAIIIVCAAVLLLSSVFAVKYISDKKEEGGEANNTTVAEAAKKEKGNNLSNAVRLVEGKNFSLSGSAEADEAAEDSLSFLSSSVFERVFVKVKAFSSSGASLSDAEEKALSAFLNKLKKNKKEVFLELDVSNKDIDIEKAAGFEDADGIVLAGTSGFGAKKLLSVFQSAKELSKSKKVFLELPFGFKDFEKLKFKKEKPDSVLILFGGKSENENEAFLKKADAFCKTNGIEICAGIRFDIVRTKNKSAALPLKNIVLSDGFDSVKSRVFLNLGDVQSDAQGCFSAAEKYLFEGIDKALVFAPLSIDGYSKGDTVKTTEHKISMVLRGSNLFPFFLDGEEIEPSADGTATVDLLLKNGKNQFTFSQCSKKLTYNVTVDFNDEIIREIKPVSAIYATPGKKLKLTVTAAAGAEVTVKAGTNRIEAKQSSKEKDGYCTYTAKITAPQSKVEIESLGRLVVTATYNGETYTKEGPSVIYVSNGSIEASTPIGKKTTAASDKLTIGNNVETASGEQTATSAATQQSTTAQKYTGNQMCVVTSDYADTWPPATNDDSFVPYYTPLVKGTIDYVTGQSQLYDEEEGVTRDFYSLASGRRVLTKDVRLVSYVNQGENKITVDSSDEKNGDLEIKLSMNWEVPYSFSFGPQAYYSAYSKRFNVSSFTAKYIQFTFYYTSSASGSVDVSKSNIASSASWSADSAQNTVSLTFELKNEGIYYGYSITRNGGELVLTLKGKPKTLSGTVVVLDPGHGGSDSGATGLSGAAYESRLNFALAVATKNELEKRGANVLMTRTDDTDITLEERKTYARQNGADLFVSIHCNASVNTSKFGTAVYYYRPFSRPLASAIYEKLCALFQNDFYASDSEKSSVCALGTIYNPFSVTRLEECPSVLVETAFITNETECRLLLDEANRSKIAAAIGDGIESFLLR